ncbi:hypothetical protein ACTXT7_015076 [Hymenolepis weldensis]
MSGEFAPTPGRLIVRRLNTVALTHKYIIKYFMNTSTQNRFVVDIPKADIEEFLKLDTQFTDQGAFNIDKGANFTAFSLLPQLRVNYQTTDDEDRSSPMDGIDFSPFQEPEDHYSTSQQSLTLKTRHSSPYDTYYFLISDTINLLAHGISRLTRKVPIHPPSRIMCQTNEIWPQGAHLVKGEEFRGYTGYVEFDSNGRRKNTNITILELSQDGTQEYGYWNEKDRLVVTKNFSTTQAEIYKELTGQVLRVATIECERWTKKQKKCMDKGRRSSCHDDQKLLVQQDYENISAAQLPDWSKLYIQVTLRMAWVLPPALCLICDAANKVPPLLMEVPFMMYKGPMEEEKSSNKNHWYGFCIDLLDEISSSLGFNYTIHPVADGNYGVGKMINGKEVWDGIIGELQSQKADLAAAMLTINYERERVIDFTTPFMNLGISIIFKKPEEKKPELFSFLRPLSPAVWGYVLIAYIGVSVALFFVARFSPYEWTNPHPCNIDSPLLKNNFNMLNSLWFTIGSLMQQGEHFS